MIMDDLNEMLLDAAQELRSAGMEALAVAVDLVREERVGNPASARMMAFNGEQLTLAGARA